MSWYNSIHFERPVRAVELGYCGRPRIPAAEAAASENAAYLRGREEATQEMNEQILHNRREVQQLLGESLETIDHKIDTALKEMLDEIPGLVVNICRRVLADVEVDGAMLKGIVDDVIGDLPSHREAVEIYLSPKDLKIFQSYLKDLDEDYPNCRFLPDASLDTADCRVSSAFGAIDARVSTKLKHIQEQLES